MVVNDKLYYINGSGVIVNTDGTEVTFEPGSYTVYYGIFSGWGSSFARGTFTVQDGSASASVTLRGTSVGTNTAYATRELYATSLYYNTTSFNHVDLRVAATYEINIGNQTYTASVYNPSVVVKVGGQVVASNTWSGTTSYEWRRDGLTLTRSKGITVELTLDLRYTDSTGTAHMIEDVVVVYNNASDVDKFIDAIAICDAVWGLDFRVSVEEIQEIIEYHTVTYQWKVYNTDGTYTNLPAGAPNPPAATSGHEAGTEYTYDTGYVTGTSFYDYDAGLLYSFHGWDTYSHSSAYNPLPSSGYYALDDGDTNGANNPTIEITADTYIYGYWTVTELSPSSAHVAIEKIIVVDGVETKMEAAEGLWFHVDTGYDGDGDSSTTIDVDYSMLAATGEYKIPVYQYDTPFVFTEQNAQVTGYTLTTAITASGDYIEDYKVSGDSVTVTMKPVYQGENVHLGTVTYTNTYTKKVGQPVHEYPELTLLKSATDTALAQSGVGFTLYSDAACETPVATFETADGGIAFLDFAQIEDVEPGTYYLKETAPLAGYHADPCVYALTLTAAAPVEELRDGQYVQVTYYSLSVAVPEDSTAAYTESDGYDRLHIYNSPVQGSLELSKTITGMAEADRSKVNALVIVHGPITRDGAGSITNIGSTWQLELNSENSWSASLEKLPLGEYLIHESFASVHGYTWTGVTYGNLETTVYNGITSGVFKVEDETAISLELTNRYEEWASADFYIKKVDENGQALAGAVFTLTTDEAGSNVVMTKTTGADGYAHFDGFTVPEGQDAVTYYLTETKAPAGYYLSDQVYKVVITAVTDNGKTAYEPGISLMAGRSTGFDIATDLLTVVNYPVLGELTVTKTFTDGLIPEDLTGIQVMIGGPNGYSQSVELNNSNGWSVTLQELPLGQYTVTEPDANVPGYTWQVSYSGAALALSEETPGYTVPGAQISAATTITNTYTRNEEIYEVPAALTVKKVGENGEALPGAVFTLERMSADGSSVLGAVSFTTGENGTVVFDLLSGFIQDGAPINGTYRLAETQAPEGYEATSATWTVTVQEDNGEIRWKLNENKNIFEGFWDWIVGNVSAGTFADGVLTVRNVRSRGKLTVEKTVTDPENMYADSEYTFTLDFSDDTFDKTFTLKAGESYSVEDIPYGTAYTLTEDTAGAAFTSAVTDEGNGKIQAAETTISVSNTYRYATHNNGLNLLKVDADDNSKIISGAGFTLYADAELTEAIGQEVFSDENGALNLPIAAAGTYYLAETTVPAGYHPNPAVYVVTAEEKAVVKNAGTADAVTELQMHVHVAGVSASSINEIDSTFAIENTAIKPVAVNVEKVWDDGDYHARPDSVAVTLYRNNEEFETVTLNGDNNWRYAWTGLTDEYIWSVDETEVPAEYVKSVTNEGDDWTVTNTRTPKPVEISVTKAWNHNGGKDLPKSISVVLYKNGEEYDVVTLSEDNGWTHTWTDLTDASVWSVNEVDVPAGYTKEIITEDGLAFTIVNTRTVNPVEVRVVKVWEASEGVRHPESVEAVLYRDGQEYDTAVLSAENDWSYSWADLTDEYTWSVDEKTVPEGYIKNVTNDGYDFTITNTKEFKYIDVSVKKVWYGADVAHPTSIQVTLYRDGVAYDTVTLSKANGWSYTWENLTDEFEWTVDEPSVPSGYTKTVRRNGYSFTITNTHEDNPNTGDLTNLFGTGAMAAVGAVGFGISALALFKSRKKEEEEQ